MQAMQEALKAAQDALKLSRSEASSRLASVKELQEKLAAQPPDQSQVRLWQPVSTPYLLESGHPCGLFIWMRGSYSSCQLPGCLAAIKLASAGSLIS